MKVKFISLASGSSGNCYYIGTEKYGILIDAGIAVRTIKKGLKEAGISMEMIRAVFVTHDHADHIKAVGGLGEKLNIPIYTTARIHEGINRSYCMTEKLYSSVRYLEKQQPMQLEDFHIESFEVPHDGTDNVISAFAGCDAETSLIFASVVTILFMMALYLPRKVITFKSFMDSLSEGFKLMVPAVTILVFAWTLKGVGDAMGLAQFVGSVVGDHASASIFIPVVLFAVAVFLSFSTGTSWGTFAILVPIATGMFAAGTNLEMMIISVSAVLAGAVCGDHISPISDTTVMSSAGAQSNHLNHVSTQMQYAAVTACVCLVGYLIAAVTRTWGITLGVSLFLLLAVLTGMRRFCAKKAENGKK